jgi:pyrroloquinoline quinone biosynthesis protein E
MGSSSKPFEVSVEVNAECNYNCGFCFGQNFLRREGKAGKILLERVLGKVAAEGIGRVRFTGGEPLLRKDLPELVAFAKDMGLFVSLNTNASLLSASRIERLSRCLDDVLVSLHAFNEQQEALLSGSAGLFDKKIFAIKELADRGVFVRIATVLSGRNIEQLELFHALVEKLPASQWVLLRPVPTPGNLFPVSGAAMGMAVEKIIGFNRGKKRAEHSLIENALPFCCYSPSKAKKVALGGLREDGHSSLFIDSSLSIKPSYFLDLPLGNALRDSVLEAWNSRFMRRMRSLEFIAEECHKCRYVRQCMGGSRFSALLVNGSLYSLDPLASPKRVALG